MSAVSGSVDIPSVPNVHSYDDEKSLVLIVVLRSGES